MDQYAILQLSPTLHECELTDFDPMRQPSERPTVLEDVVVEPNGTPCSYGPIDRTEMADADTDFLQLNQPGRHHPAAMWADDYR